MMTSRALVLLHYAAVLLGGSAEALVAEVERAAFF